jgi:hypothetical protein
MQVHDNGAQLAVGNLGVLSREIQLNIVVDIPIVGKVREMQLHIWDTQLYIRSTQLSNCRYET